MATVGMPTGGTGFLVDHVTPHGTKVNVFSSQFVFGGTVPVRYSTWYGMERGNFQGSRITVHAERTLPTHSTQTPNTR